MSRRNSRPRCFSVEVVIRFLECIPLPSILILEEQRCRFYLHGFLILQSDFVFQKGDLLLQRNSIAHRHRVNKWLRGCELCCQAVMMTRGNRWHFPFQVSSGEHAQQLRGLVGLRMPFVDSLVRNGSSSATPFACFSCRLPGKPCGLESSHALLSSCDSSLRIVTVAFIDETCSAPCSCDSSFLLRGAT